MKHKYKVIVAWTVVAILGVVLLASLFRYVIGVLGVIALVLYWIWDNRQDARAAKDTQENALIIAAAQMMYSVVHVCNMHEYYQLPDTVNSMYVTPPLVYKNDIPVVQFRLTKSKVSVPNRNYCRQLHTVMQKEIERKLICGEVSNIPFLCFCNVPIFYLSNILEDQYYLTLQVALVINENIAREIIDMQQRRNNHHFPPAPPQDPQF